MNFFGTNYSDFVVNNDSDFVVTTHSYFCLSPPILTFVVTTYPYFRRYTMAMTEIISPPTASIGTFASFTLARLPGETRNRIYQYAFEGSRMTLYRTDGSPRTPNDDDQESCRDGDCACQAIFRGSGHHRLLLTCRAVHDEARAIYWEQTTISAASSEDHIFSPNYFLSRIPDFAKSFVEHIEHCIRLGLNSRPPHDTLNGLRQFPNLKTVTLRDHLVELLIWCMEAPFVIKFEVYDVYRWAIKEWHAGLGSQLQDHETSTCPVFLQKVDFNMRPDRRDGNNVVAGDKVFCLLELFLPPRISFVPCSAGESSQQAGAYHRQPSSTSTSKWCGWARETKQRTRSV